MCDLGDLEGLTRLLVAAISRIKAGFRLDRDDYER
jgi:putative aminopeptidase